MRFYRLVPPANRDLVAILEYLHSNSPAAADRFLTSLDRRLTLLASSPSSGRRRDEFGHPHLRYITFGAYIIAYDPATNPLVITAILHGSRDLISVMKDRR